MTEITNDEQYRSALKRLEELKQIVSHPFAWGCNSERDEIESAIWRYKARTPIPTPMLDRLSRLDAMHVALVDGQVQFDRFAAEGSQPVTLTSAEVLALAGELRAMAEGMNEKMK